MKPYRQFLAEKFEDYLTKAGILYLKEKVFDELSSIAIDAEIEYELLKQEADKQSHD
jgi:hypothetical protein